MTTPAWPFTLPPARPADPLGAGLWRFQQTPGGALHVLASLDAAAFPDPGRPGAAALAPAGWDPRAPLDVLVYLHGFSNCVESVVSDAGAVCIPGSGHTCGPSKLLTQLLASGRNALLVVPGLRVDQQTGECGALRKPGGFRRLLDELLGKLLPALGAPARGAADAARIGIMCHSGGYTPAALAIRAGDLSALREVVLLDALYGEIATFEHWVTSHAAEFGTAAAPGPYRFGCVYTGGTPAERSVALATRLARALPPGALLHDKTGATLAPGDYRAPVIVKHSTLSHGDTSRYYPGQFWRPVPPA